MQELKSREYYLTLINEINSKFISLEKESEEIDKNGKAAIELITAAGADELSVAIKRTCKEMEEVIDEICIVQSYVNNLPDNFNLEKLIASKKTKVKIGSDFLSMMAIKCNDFNIALKYLDTKAKGMAASEMASQFERVAESFCYIQKAASDTKSAISIAGYYDEIEKDRAAAEKKQYDKKSEKNKQINELTEQAKKMRDEFEEAEKMSNEAGKIVISNNVNSPNEFEENANLYIGMRKSITTKSTNVTIPAIKYCKTIVEREIPWTIDLADASYSDNIFIRVSDKDYTSQDFVESIENIMLNFINTFPLLKKKILVVDTSIGSNFKILPIMADKCPSLLLSDAMSENMSRISSIGLFAEFMDKKIADLINTRLDILPKSKTESIYEYNYKNQSNVQSPILIVIRLSSDIDEKYLAKLEEIIAASNKAGITFVLMAYDEDSKLNLKQKEQIDLLEDSTEHKLIYNKNYTFIDGKYCLNLDCRTKDFEIDKFFDSVNIAAKSENKFITITEIQPKEDFASSQRREDFSTTLKIPFGKEAGRVVDFELSSNAENAHALVYGTTGSGKTVFLHDLILSGAYNYSPAELEISIFAFQKANEFSIYNDKNLPHLKYLCTSDQSNYSLMLLDYLGSINKERTKLFGNCENIEKYNKKQKEEGLPTLPRIMIIIDEYQQILGNKEFISVLEGIIRVGRSQGISLILSSNKAPDADFRELRKQITNDVVFGAKAVAEFLPNLAKRASELDLQGTCFYQCQKSGGTRIKVARCAYINDNVGREAFIEQIIAKYSTFRANQIEVGKPQPLLIEQEPIVTIGKAALEKLKEDITCLVDMGARAIEKGKIVSCQIDYDNPFVLIMGNYIKCKHIEASLLKGMLIDAKALNVKKTLAYYVDLDVSPMTNRKAQVVKDIKILKGQDLDGSTFENFYFGQGQDDLQSTLIELKNIAEERKQKNRVDYPIMLIVSHADNLAFGRDCKYFNELEDIIKDGRDVGIYTSMQFCSPIRDNKNRRDVESLLPLSSARTFITIGDSEEKNENNSNNLINFINDQNNIDDNVKMAYSDKLSKENIDSAFALYVANNKIEIFLPYIYAQETWAMTLANCSLKERSDD